MTESSNYNSWIAKVKYKVDGAVENVPVKNIQIVQKVGKETVKIPFTPTTFTDFRKDIWYSVKTNLKISSGKYTRYFAQIGKLAASEKHMKEMEQIPQHRIRWQNLKKDDLEPTDTSQSEAAKETGTPLVLNERQKKKLILERRADTSRREYDRYLEGDVIHTPAETSEVRSVGTSNVPEASSSSTNAQRKRNASPTSEVAALRKRVKELEEELQETQSPNLSNISEQKLLDVLQKQLGDFGNRLKSEIEKSVRHEVQEMNGKIELLQNAISSVPSTPNNGKSQATSVKSSSGVYSNVLSDEKIALGRGVFCLKDSFEELEKIRPERIADWSLCLLKGIFGSNAHLMRINPRVQTHKPFSDDFIGVAKALYRKYLEKHWVIHEDGKKTRKFDQNALALECDRLLPYLSKRCENMGGPRGLQGRIKMIRDAGGDVSELVAIQRARAAKNAARPNKRPYIKRGSTGLAHNQKKQQQAARENLVTAPVNPSQSPPPSPTRVPPSPPQPLSPCSSSSSSRTSSPPPRSSAAPSSPHPSTDTEDESTSESEPSEIEGPEENVEVESDFDEEAILDAIGPPGPKAVHIPLVPYE